MREARSRASLVDCSSSSGRDYSVGTGGTSGSSPGGSVGPPSQRFATRASTLSILSPTFSRRSCRFASRWRAFRRLLGIQLAAGEQRLDLGDVGLELGSSRLQGVEPLQGAHTGRALRRRCCRAGESRATGRERTGDCQSGNQRMTSHSRSSRRGCWVVYRRPPGPAYIPRSPGRGHPPRETSKRPGKRGGPGFPGPPRWRS